MAGPAELEINKYLPQGYGAQGIPGPEEAPSRKQGNLGPTHLCQGAGQICPQTTGGTQRGPGGTCRPGSGFPHRGGTQLPTLAQTGSGFQVTHMNKMQK